MDLDEEDAGLSWGQGFWHTKGDSLMALQGFADRMKDIVREEIGTDIPPIRGLSNIPLVPLQEAVEGLVELVPNIDSCFEQCQRYLAILKGLPVATEQDDFQVLLLMTWPWGDLEGAHSLYHLLNSKLREPNREELQPYLSLLKVFFNSLHNLPSYKGSAWGGVTDDVTSTYKEGQRLTWFGFSSFSPNIRTVTRPNFVGRYGNKTLFNLKISKGFQLNLVPNSPEVILPPGTQVRVKNVYNAGEGVKIVELQELVPEVSPFDFPDAVNEVGSEEFYLERLGDSLSRRHLNTYMQILKQLPMDKECYLYTSLLQSLSEFISEEDYSFNHDDESSIAKLVLNVMMLQSETFSVQNVCLSLLCTLGVFKSDAWATQTIKAIARMLRNNVDAVDLQLDGHRALQEYLTNDRSRILAGNEGVIKTSLLVLNAHAEDLAIVERIYQTLALLALSRGMCSKLGSSGILNSLFPCLKVNLENPVILQPMLLLLGRLASDSENQTRIGNEDGVDLILDTLKKHPSHAGILQNCCHTLSRLAQDERSRDTIAVRGGISIIVTTMTSSSSNGSVLQKGCMALANLAKSNSNALAICRENGMELILQAMGDHETSTSLQEAACMALQNLWQYSPSSVAEDTVIAKIRTAMVLHFDQRGVQTSACSAVGTIWENTHKDSQLSEETVGAVEAILRAVTCHHDHAATQQNGFLVLAKMSNNAQVQNVIHNSGVTVALSALQCQFKRPHIQETILMFLEALSQKSSFQKAIIQHGGVDLVAKTMVKAPYNIQIQAHGSGILASLSKDADHHRKLSHIIVMEAMSNTKVQHPHNERIQNNVNVFLKTERTKHKKNVKNK